MLYYYDALQMLQMEILQLLRTALIYVRTVDFSGIFCRELAVLGSSTASNVYTRKRPVLKLI